MTLAPGTRLGPYEILSTLGAGGMGEVYKARDTRLDRVVAVKILSASTSSSPDARQRFEREARTISQLSHPHICALYDVGEAPNPESQAPSPEPLQFLVMELLEGETLAQRLFKGPLPLDQTLRYGMEMADALDKAHRQGIVHRDLKPANVMVTRSGVKLLDFGLAKAAAPLFPGSMSIVETAAAVPQLSAQGTLAGTLQYMSPEQLEDRPVDARSDIFALGAVLYEMATGKRAFTAGSPVAVASAILHAEPPPFAPSSSAIPPTLERLVRTCLAKDPDERWQSAHDVKLQLAAIADERSGSIAAGVTARPWVKRGLTAWAPWLLAAAALTALLLAVRARTPPPAIGSISFLVSPPPNTTFPATVETVPFALSPDGSRLAMVAYEPDGQSRLWLRTVSSVESRAVAGTEGADGVFWSPDGRSLAFFAGNKLKRVDTESGAVVPLCDVRPSVGKSGTWGRDGQMLFAPVDGDAIYRTSTAGETPVAVVKPSQAAGGLRVVWPSFLPDGRRFLYLEKSTGATGSLMMAEAGQTPHRVMALASNAQYVDSGYLVFAREAVLLGQTMDLATGRLAGESFPVANPVRYFLPTGGAMFSVSRGGALAYQARGSVAKVVRVDRTGKELGALGTSGQNARLHLSRDGQTATLDRAQSGSGTMDVWSIDLARGVEARLTSDPATEVAAVLVPGAHAVIFSSSKRGTNLMRKDLETGVEEFLLPFSRALQMAEDVSPDGRTLLFSQRADGGQDDLWTLPLSGTGSPAPYLTSPAQKTGARIAPDGRFAAYVSNESGRDEVHVASFPARGAPTRVSSGGGRHPRWSPDGHELFYIAGDGQLMAVPIRTTPALQVGRPVAVFGLGHSQRWAEYDVLPDGGFLAIILEIGASEQPLIVVLNGAQGPMKP